MGLTQTQIHTLGRLASMKSPRNRAELLHYGGPGLQHTIRECAHNVLKGNVPLSAVQKTRLKKHAKSVRELASRRTSLKKRLKIQQKGGFLPLLIAPILASVAGGVASSLIAKL